MGTEIWRTAVVNGEIYENYQVSNLGRVMSLNYHRSGKPKMLIPLKRGNGYLFVNIRKNGKIKLASIHRLVCEAFLPNSENKPFVNHKIEGDKGKTINMVIFNEDGSINKEKSTIEWVTAKENCNYGTCIQRVAKALSKSVLQFSKSGEFVREWESANEAGRNGYDFRNVSACCLGKRKSAYGYIWRYKEDYS